MHDYVDIHTWLRFWKALNRRKPKYAEACDALRMLDGEPTQQRNKVLQFKKRVASSPSV